jgi:hypothetical protein
MHTDIYALSGNQTHDPSVRASEDSSCLRPRCHCDRANVVTAAEILLLNAVLNRIALPSYTNPVVLMSSGADTVGTGFVLPPSLKSQLVINQEAGVLKH